MPDYELEHTREIADEAGLKAVADPTRQRILSLLTERAATTKQLADAMDKPPGTVGHHVKVLEEAGLVTVVRTRQVRAITEKYYGRTAQLFILRDPHAKAAPKDEVFGVLDRVRTEAAWPPVHDVGGATVRHARIPPERAGEWMQRIHDLVLEFTSEEPDGDTVYGLVIGLYETTLRGLPPDEQD